MENSNPNDQENNLPKDHTEEDDTQFENPSVDPGFESSEPHGLSGREDKRTGNIDVNKSIKEMREEHDAKSETEEPKGDDALNYNNDRENGAYNPKNI